MRRSGGVWVAPLLLAVALGCDDRQPLAPKLEAANSASTFPAPSNAAVKAASSVQIDVSWQDNTGNEGGFEVWGAATGVSSFSLWATTGPNVITKSFSGLHPAQEYCAKTRAFTLLGQSGKIRAYSAYSNTACVTTPAVAGPSKVTARPLGSSYVEITWSNDIVVAPTGFRLERSLDQGATWNLLVKTDGSATGNVDYGRAAESPELCYRVIALTQYGESTPSAVRCTTPPAAPTALSASGVAGPAIALSWTDNSAVEDGYQVLRGPDEYSLIPVANLPANATSYRDASVTANTRYWYQVLATKDSGFSDASISVSAVAATQPPAAPSNTDAWPGGSSQVTVVWSSQSTNQDGFRIERSMDGQATWVLAGTTSVEWQTQFTDADRTSERAVCYRVIAYNGLGDSPASNVDCTTPPAAPSNLVATTVPGGEIDLTWTDNSSVEDGYEVDEVDCYYDYDGNYYCSYYPVGSVGANGTTYQVTGLPPGLFITYEVHALKDNGGSDPSNQAGAASDLPPPAPSNLTATAVSAGQIDLAWTLSSTGDVYVAVERCEGDAVMCGDPGAAWGFVAWTVLDATRFSDPALLSGVAYTYRVLACNPGGGSCSDPSNLAMATAP